MKSSKSYFTVAEAAKLVGVSDKTMYHHIATGKLAAKTLIVVPAKALWHFVEKRNAKK